MKTFKHRAKKIRPFIKKGISDRRISRELFPGGKNKIENQNNKKLIIEMWDNYLTFTGLGI